MEFCTELRCVTHILTHYLRHFHHAAGFQHNFADKGEHGAQQSDICCFKADLETRHFFDKHCHAATAAVARHTRRIILSHYKLSLHSAVNIPFRPHRFVIP